MGYFASFATITTLLFALLLYFLRGYLPLRTPVLFLIVLTSFLLAMTFPLLSTMVEWHNLSILFASFIAACVFLIYLVDQNVSPTQKEVLTAEHRAGGPVTAIVKDIPQQNVKDILSNTDVKDASHDMEILKVSASDCQLNVQAIITAPIFDIIQMDKSWSVIEIPSIPEPGQIELEHDVDSLQQDTNHNSPTTSDNQEEHKPVFDEEKMDLNSIIAKGFSLRLAGDMPGAVNCFMNAMHFSSDAKLNVMLGSEISAIYNQMGQSWQAAEILNILLDTWGDQLEPKIKTDLTSNLKLLQ